MNINDFIEKNVSLKNLNTFKLDGKAKYFLLAKKKSQLEEGLRWAKTKEKKVLFLGGGSNILVPDTGIDALVIKIANDDYRLLGRRLECGAGLSLSRAGSLAKSHELSGLEWSAGIPRACIGGAIRGNAEAFQTAMADILENVEIFNIAKNRWEILSNKMCNFAYRDSLFKKNKRLIVWQATLLLTKSKADTIQKKISASLDFRCRYPSLPSAGSIFENLNPNYVKKNNPTLFERELKNKISRNGKISAGLIIDMAGLKGKSIGGIKISLEHANHIVNTGQGKSEEVLMMISFIKQQIRDRFGIQLKEEISYFGF